MPSALNSRRGFTLFELLLVIVLIGILYGVFINKLTSTKETEAAEALTIGTIGDYLRSFSADEEVEFICLEAGLECGVYVDDKRVETVKVRLFETPPVVYRQDGYGQLREIEFLPWRNGDGVLKEVCFRFTKFKNGSSSHYILGYEDRFYLFDAYLRPTQTFSALSDAEKAFSRTDLLPDEERNYDF